MKKTFLAVTMVTLLCGISGPVRAGGPGMCPMCSGKMDAGKKADHLAVMLDLNDKQKDEVKRLAEAKQKRLEPLVDKLHSEAKAADDEFEAGVKKVLTAKQAKKFDALKDMRDEHGKD